MVQDVPARPKVGMSLSSFTGTVALLLAIFFFPLTCVRDAIDGAAVSTTPKA